jgi:hypothetical protein
MPRQAKYGVKFVGYGAYVIARKNRQEVQYAMLDFVTGGVILNADRGWVRASHRVDLEPFLKSLPDRASELHQILRQGAVSPLVQALGEATGVATDMVTLDFGENSVWLFRNADVSKFIRKLETRFYEIKQVLQQAEEIGSQISRRPYCDYINELKETGIARVECQGFGLSIEGNLNFHPSPQVRLVTHRKPNIFELHEPGTPPKMRSN